MPNRAPPLSGHVPLWLVDPPEPVRVLRPRRKGGRPRLAQPGTGGGKGAGRRILQWGGPWKLVDATALTTGEPLRRDYYQVETEDGHAYLVFWDRVADAWLLQGIFD